MFCLNNIYSDIKNQYRTCLCTWFSRIYIFNGISSESIVLTHEYANVFRKENDLQGKIKQVH